MQLLRFHAASFCRISGILSQAWVLLNRGAGLDLIAKPLGENLGELQRECERLGLAHTLMLLQRVLREIEEMPPGSSLQPLSRRLTDIYERLIDELEPRVMLAVPVEGASYFEGKDLFGAEVARNFPSVAWEIEEAGACLALNRNTACVFHLMRVMESGLRAIGRSLADPRLDPTRNPSWEAILKKCDEELIKPLRERMPEWRADEHFFSTATANLRAVKDAWRNPTMHVDRQYSDEQAAETWNAVKAFMRHLATKLSEVSPALSLAGGPRE